MEGEKYNLVKAQEEAEKLQKKVASGEATNYGDAEKLVEQEIKKREVLASEIGLKTDSKLVEVLSSLDQGARDEIISSLADRANATFGDYFGKDVVQKIFESLNYNSFAERIKTPEDFQRYANKVMEVAELHLKKDSKGKVDGQSFAASYTSETVASMIWLVRGDFDRDLDTMLQMMRDNPSPKQEENIAGALRQVGGLIRTSEDLERVGQFVRRLSEKGFDAKAYIKALFGDQFAENTDKRDERGNYIYEPDEQFKAWQEIITDSKKLDDALSVMEAAFTHGANPEVFVNGVGRRFVKDATPEQLQELERHISSLADRANATFGDYFGKDVVQKIFESLNYNSFAERIKTPEDFQRYANKVMEVAELHLKKDSKGKVDGQSFAASYTSETVASMIWLVRGDFDRDLDTMLQMMRDNPSPKQEENIAGALRQVGGLIRTSEDLERVGQFVRRLSEKGFDAKAYIKALFGDQFAKNTYKRDERGNYIYEPDEQFKAWEEIITDSKKLDDALSVMEAAFTHGANPEVFVKKINSLTKEECEQFIVLAQKFAAKEIPQQFVADNLPLLQNCDFSKEGLELFTSFEAQKKWLEYCVQVWKQNPQNIDNVAKFFSEALSSEIKAVSKKEYKVGNIKGLSAEELADIQENVDEELGSAVETTKPNEKLRVFASKLLQSALGELYESKNFEAIAKIQESINGSAEAILVLDQVQANKLTEDDLIKFIPALGSTEADKLFPITFGKAKEMIFAKLATDQDLADYFVENLDKYYQQSWVPENIVKAIQQYSVAQKFIYAVEDDQAAWKNEAWVADVFAEAKTIVEEYQKKWDWDPDEDWQADEYGYRHGAKGFSEKDPYENHPWRFGGRQIRISSALAELMIGQADGQKLKELGITEKEIVSYLVEANKKIESAYQNFLEQIRSNPNIKEEDKQSLLNPESSSVRMTPLIDNVRAFVARYFVQSVEGDVTRLSEIVSLSSDLDRIIAEGFRRYIKVHEVDVPLYDKLYEEFDNLRETGRYSLEVFLGRDGIYAWIGRRAQDVARRRKMGLEGRKKLREMGEVIEIHPQYIVYPRYFRDNLNYETKRQFLEQEGISPDADPLFYDTGYTGTIPEQIMKVMGFEPEDIEKRIRLLSAPSVHRRVKGISENARSEIIEYIEHNAKLEETAEGLIADEKTGKIRHIARPTNPEEQFYFMMIKQAVARHYWLQETLHHEPSGNINLDSEHYAIRIRQDYAKLLPQEFLHDPKAFFTGHGELLKGSKGEGEYPDEEVILFKLTDGTEIVAKRIELRKAKEARKEFAILIAAKKARLPTAEPVGFLLGKEDADGSYLLMKKLEGRSGRKFEKELREAGKYSDEQIKDIMKQVAEKNREMAELFRTTLKIDKRWRIKDTIIEFNEETGEVESVIPIDWERAQNYNPNTPKEIDEIA